MPVHIRPSLTSSWLALLGVLAAIAAVVLMVRQKKCKEQIAFLSKGVRWISPAHPAFYCSLTIRSRRR